MGCALYTDVFVWLPLCNRRLTLLILRQCIQLMQTRQGGRALCEDYCSLPRFCASKSSSCSQVMRLLMTCRGPPFTSQYCAHVNDHEWLLLHRNPQSKETPRWLGSSCKPYAGLPSFPLCSCMPKGRLCCRHSKAKTRAPFR